ncbi:hypothetical protein B0H19DRAFT_1079559 [Mycena capillaripes]|nr:hypothetical protein B0H19DRAFT_1079559 [Mycena capillaripes]
MATPKLMKSLMYIVPYPIGMALIDHEDSRRGFTTPVVIVNSWQLARVRVGEAETFGPCEILRHDEASYSAVCCTWITSCGYVAESLREPDHCRRHITGRPRESRALEPPSSSNGDLTEQDGEGVAVVAVVSQGGEVDDVGLGTTPDAEMSSPGSSRSPSAKGRRRSALKGEPPGRGAVRGDRLDGFDTEVVRMVVADGREWLRDVHKLDGHEPQNPLRILNLCGYRAVALGWHAVLQIRRKLGKCPMRNAATRTSRRMGAKVARAAEFATLGMPDFPDRSVSIDETRGPSLGSAYGPPNKNVVKSTRQQTRGRQQVKRGEK